MKVEADPGVIMELADAFTWMAPNYKFHPKYKAKVWDGKITLCNRMSGVMLSGLTKRVKQFCDVRDYTISFDPEFVYQDISEDTIVKFIDSLKIPMETRDYQLDTIVACIRAGRRTVTSATSSGKSFMMYVLSQWYDDNKALIIVPTISLVKQMESDFREYGYKGKIHTSLDGLSKDFDIDSDIVITTWQSLDNGKSKMPRSWFAQFGLVIGDECHGAKAAVLSSIIGNLINCKHRFGVTGTLDGDPLNEATIEGLFGPRYQGITSAELIEKGFATKLKIKCLMLSYPDDFAKDMKGKSYHEEIEALVNKSSRNKFIRDLTLSLNGNKLVFFRLTDHGKILKELIEAKSRGPVYYVDGSVDAINRESIRQAIEKDDDATLIASLGTTSTGVNIKKLHNMIAASPSKSKIKVLQSIGRMLRLHDDKEVAILYDIVDDLSIKSHQNYTLKHFKERLKIYSAEGFPFEIHKIRLK